MSRLGLLLVGGSWPGLVGLVLLDRMGKGVRTAPRDAMISLSTPSPHLGAAFGAHRSLDMVGAMTGPVLAFAVLAAVPGGYDAVFVVSLCAGLIGLGVITLLVREPVPASRATASAGTLRSAVGLVRDRRFAALLVAASALGAATLSDGFVYLALQDRIGFPIGLFPLLYVATSLVFLVLALPMGRLADKVGRLPVFLGGHVLLLAVYAMLFGSGSGAMWAVCAIVLFGAYYAATDGVLVAMAGAVLPERMRGSGLAMLGTATSLARLASSILFGLLWAALDVRTAVLAFGAALVVALAVALATLVRHPTRR
jgi:MFS family permease